MLFLAGAILRLAWPETLVVLPPLWRDSLTITPPRPYAFRGESLWVLMLPGDTLELEYFALPRWLARASSSGPIKPPSKAPGAQGQVVGTRTLSLVWSGGGTSLSGATDLQLEGELGGGWRAYGRITESGAGGTELTRSLLELDRALFGIKGARGEVELGNLRETRELGGRAWSGELLGVSLSGEGGWALAGQEMGAFRVVEVRLREGDPGPYSLGVRVAPGSERVFLEGRRLSRERDYRIQEEEGTITLMPGVRVREGEVLRVEFREWGEDNPSFCGLGSFLGFGAFYRREIPPDVPGLDTLHEGDLAFGGQYVGEGQGDYTYDGQIFTYVGQGKGDWRVSFTYVGEGQGSYSYNSLLGGYEYVGQGQGSYEPLVRVRLPKEQIWAGWSYRGAKDTLFVSASGTKANITSDVPRVWAGLWRGSWARGSLRLRTGGWTPGFWSPTGLAREEEAIRWGLLPGDRWEWGELGLELLGFRLEGGSALTDTQTLGSIGLTAERDSLKASARRVWGRDFIYSLAEVRFEIEDWSAGARHRDWGDSSLSSVEAGFSAEEFGLWARAAQKGGNLGLSTQVSLSPGPLGLVWSRVVWFGDTQGTRDGIEARLRLGPLSARALWSAGVQRLREERFVYVGEGRGEWSPGPDGFHRDPYGSYSRVFVSLPGVLPAQEAELSASLPWLSASWQARWGEDGLLGRRASLSGAPRWGPWFAQGFYAGNLDLEAGDRAWWEGELWLGAGRSLMFGPKYKERGEGGPSGLVSLAREAVLAFKLIARRFSLSGFSGGLELFEPGSGHHETVPWVGVSLGLDWGLTGELRYRPGEAGESLGLVYPPGLSWGLFGDLRAMGLGIGLVVRGAGTSVITKSVSLTLNISFGEDGTGRGGN